MMRKQTPEDLFDLVHESIFTRDLAGKILSWNAASAQLYGWTADEALGQSAHALLQTRHDQPLADLEDLARRSGRWDGEVSRCTASGSERVIEARWSVRRDDDGHPVEIIEVGRDITDRRAAEAALEASQRRYSSLFQAMAASFWQLDFNPVGMMLKGLFKSGVTDLPAYFATHPDFVRGMMRATRIVDVNDETVKLFGGGRREDMGDNVEPFWTEDSASVYAASVVAAVSGRPDFSAETRFRRCDGTEFDGLFTACFPDQGVARGTLLIGVIDISARKKATAELQQSESRYRNLFHHMPISLWQIDSPGLMAVMMELKAQGVTNLDAHLVNHPDVFEALVSRVMVTDVNDRTVQMFGGEGVADFIGRADRFWRVRPETLRRSLAARFAGEPNYTEETRVPTLDGREIDILYTIAWPTPLSDMGLSIVGVVDVTERVRAEAALQSLQDKFAHSARVSMLGELTASIAHEVNQPLAAIATNAAAGMRWLGREQPNVEQALTLTQRIVADAQRAGDIIARIRTMAANRPVAPETMPINAVIEESVRFLQHELQASGVSLSLDLAADLPPVRADRTQLQQVLVNLAVNAVQSMAGAGTVRPELGIRSWINEEGQLHVFVRDNGPGLVEAVMARLFDSFFTTKASGMGMGLPICRSIMEAHGGSIRAGNADDGGAVFTLVLPAAPQG